MGRKEGGREEEREGKRHTVDIGNRHTTKVGERGERERGGGALILTVPLCGIANTSMTVTV